MLVVILGLRYCNLVNQSVLCFQEQLFSIWFVSFALKYSNVCENMKCELNSLRKSLDMQIWIFSTFVYTESIRITAIQWRLRLSGSSVIARVFDYDLYCRTLSCLLCVFVAQLNYFTVKVVNSNLFHWALSLFIYFVPILAIRVHVACNWNQKMLFVECVLSTSFSRALLGFVPQSPSCHLQSTWLYCLLPTHPGAKQNKKTNAVCKCLEAFLSLQLWDGKNSWVFQLILPNTRETQTNKRNRKQENQQMRTNVPIIDSVDTPVETLSNMLLEVNCNLSGTSENETRNSLLW